MGGQTAKAIEYAAAIEARIAPLTMMVDRLGRPVPPALVAVRTDRGPDFRVEQEAGQTVTSRTSSFALKVAVGTLHCPISHSH